MKLRARNYILALRNKNPSAWTVICLLDAVVGSWFGSKPGTPCGMADITSGDLRTVGILQLSNLPQLNKLRNSGCIL